MSPTTDAKDKTSYVQVIIVGSVGGFSSSPPRAMLAVAYATGRASHARRVKGDDPDEKGYPGPPGWGLCVGLTNLHLSLALLKMGKSLP